MGRQEEETARLDQPDPRIEWDEDYEAERPVHAAARDRLVDKKPSKKHIKKGQSLRDMAYETMSASNVITRDDMARGLHKAGSAIDQVVGKPLSQGVVETEALVIIGEHGQGISTSLGQWQLIQSLVEEAYRRGHRDGFHLASGR